MKTKQLLSISLFLFLLIFSCKAMSINNTDESDSNKSDRGPVFNNSNLLAVAELQGKLRTIAQNESSSIVSISTEKIIKGSQNYNSPFDFFFRNDPYNQSPKQKEYKQGGLGSGVIYMKKGNVYYVITNNHVIEGVDTIKVIVDQERSYDGEVIATDPEVDIGVVKIKTKDELRVARIGDSSKLQAGDFVVAIGNPFGLQGTMTFGIVSALGRNDISSGQVNLTNFIQTDAAINPGNSGGALLNLEGEVIGINTLIYSQSGGNIGIGFAIPVNIAKRIANQIIENGKVEHGYLGVSFEELDEEKIDILNLGKIKGGMHVLKVFEDSPAEESGLKPGDVLLQLNGKKLLKSSDLTLTIGNSKPGTKVKFKVLRNGKEVTVEVTLGNRDQLTGASKKNNKESEVIEEYGFELTNLTSELRKSYKVPSGVNGVVVVDVLPRSIAASAGMEAGDVITKINNKNAKNVDEVKRIFEQKKGECYFFVNRKGKEFIIRM